MSRKTNRGRHNPSPKARHLTRKEASAMSARGFLRRLVRNVLCLTAALLAFAACAYTDYRLWPLDLQAPRYPVLPAPKFQGNQLVLPFAPGIAAAEVATFHDQLEARNLIAHYDLNTWTQKYFSYYQQQSHTFDVAYGVPTEQKLESLSSFQLLTALARFLVFKSQTDNRVMERADSAPRPLTREQATQLAADILDVAQFYSLPLDYFLGVGAMENDYMDVNGDLTHAVWKKRAQRDDIILRRGRKRVMVSNYAIGTWQITRETLRAAHQLYLKDKRDYTQLPARLRPPRDLNLNSVDDAVLTTYAGLLLRGLLDRFDGDVDKATGAYNGGVKSPNPAYASGVKTVAEYARRVLEHATVLENPAANAKKPAIAQPHAAASPNITNGAPSATPAPPSAATSQPKQP